MNVKRILFPTDLSDCSLAALDYASDLAATCAAELHILYVDDLVALVALGAYTCPSFVASSARVELRERLESIKPTLSNVRCEYHFVEGVAADEICKWAESEMDDLIVMSSHGRSGLSRVLFGSVAEKVLRSAKCPVLIVKQLANSAVGDNKLAEATQTANVRSPAAVGNTQVSCGAHFSR